MPSGGSYTISMNDFLFITCAKAADEALKLPKTYTFLECSKDINTLENAIKYRKESRMYGLLREYCSGLDVSLSEGAKYYIKNGVYIGDDTCPISNDTKPDVVVEKKDAIATMFQKVNDGKNITEELKKTEEIKKETSGFLSSVSSTLLSGINNFNDLKNLSLNKLETAASSIGITKRSFTKLMGAVDKLESRGLIGGDINTAKHMLLVVLYISNLYDAARTPEVLGLLSNQLGISEQNLQSMLNTAQNVRTLSDIQDLNTYLDMDFSFKEKFAAQNFIPTEMLDDIMPLSLQLYSPDENVRKLAEESARRLMGEKIIEMVSPNIPDLKPGIDPGTNDFLKNFSNMDYKIQKVSAVALGFGSDEAGVLECRTVMQQLDQYKQLDEQSTSLKTALYDHTNKLYTDKDLNPKIIDDYLEEHGLKQEELVNALNVSDKLKETTIKTSYQSETGDWVSNDTHPDVTKLEVDSTGNIPAVAVIPTIRPELVIKTDTPNGPLFTYNGSLEFRAEDLKDGKIPVKFYRTTGNFICKNIGLKSLENCPQTIGGEFDCSNNELRDLIGGPNEVGTNYRCTNNKLESIKGVAYSIGSSYEGSTFNCSNNPLKSLETGRTQEVVIFGNMVCTDTTLSTFANTALEITYRFDASRNDLRHIDLFKNAILKVNKEIKLQNQKNTEKFNLQEITERTGADTILL